MRDQIPLPSNFNTFSKKYFLVWHISLVCHNTLKSLKKLICFKYFRYILGQMMSPSGIGVVSHLNITRARVEDGGLYACIAYEGDVSTKHGARIDVYGMCLVY